MSHHCINISFSENPQDIELNIPNHTNDNEVDGDGYKRKKVIICFLKYIRSQKKS